MKAHSIFCAFALFAVVSTAFGQLHVETIGFGQRRGQGPVPGESSTPPRSVGIAGLSVKRPDPVSMQLWHKIDIASYGGSFVCLGDLTGDRQVDFLLYRQGPQTTPGFIVAVDHMGRTLWKLGDRSIKKHMADGVWNEPCV